jgi:hypothetical protein
MVSQTDIYPFELQENASLPNVGRLENILFSRLKLQWAMRDSNYRPNRRKKPTMSSDALQKALQI